jgi:hypothetical protein
MTQDATESVSADRSAVNAALMAFGRRYLDALNAQDPSRRARPIIGAWGPHPQIPGLFVPLEHQLVPSNFDEWEEYVAIEELMASRPRLHRLVTEPMYKPADPVPELKSLLTSVVALPIERYQAIHGSDARGWRTSLPSWPIGSAVMLTRRSSRYR